MEIQVLWRVLSQRWRIVVVVTLLAVVGALTWTLTGPVSYIAQGRVIISTSGSLGTATDAYSSEQVSIARAPTYAALLEGEEVASRASKILNGDISAQTVQESVDAQISSRLPMVIVSATSNSANDAVQIVAATEQGLQQYVKEIERPGRDGSLTSVVLSADAPVVSRDSHPVRNALLAALLGIVLGSFLAIYRDRTDPVVKSFGQMAGLGFAYRGSINLADDADSLSASFRRIATGIAVSGSNDPARLLVVGIDRDANVDSVARGLAEGMAACGRVVTLVDEFDATSSASRPGFVDVLTGSSEWSEVKQPTDTENMTRMGFGAGARELDAVVVTGVDTQDLKQAVPVSDTRERVVIAGPSIAHSSVAVALTSVADAVLVVVQTGSSETEDVIEARMTLEAMNVPAVGVLLVVREKDAPSEPVSTSGDDATTIVPTESHDRHRAMPPARTVTRSESATSN